MATYHEREWPAVAYLIYRGHQLTGEPVEMDGTFQFPFDDSAELQHDRDEFWLSEYKAVQEIYRKVVAPKTKRR